MTANEPIEQACLRSAKVCRVLRRQMTAPQLLRAYDLECQGKRRREVLMLLVLQHCRIVRAQRLARIARVRPKPTHVSTRRADWWV